MSSRFTRFFSLISLITHLGPDLPYLLCARIFHRCFTSISSRLTNDGNAILREIDVAHPAAKNMIELSRTQDEECGDGTTSVIILGSPI